jgi:hypothetical protein
MSLFITNAVKQFEYYQSLGTKTIDRLTEDELLFQPQPEANSIAMIVQHMVGNMLSRWTDFLTTDGEKEWRNRDEEFAIKNHTKENLLAYWSKGWDCMYDAIKPLTDEDLQKIIYIRNLGQTAQDAIARQLCHYSYHIGQIVYIGIMLKNKDWESLSIPKNKSADYNKALFDQEKTVKHFNDK